MNAPTQILCEDDEGDTAVVEQSPLLNARPLPHKRQSQTKRDEVAARKRLKRSKPQSQNPGRLERHLNCQIKQVPSKEGDPVVTPLNRN